jgi:hypothetical protein
MRFVGMGVLAWILGSFDQHEFLFLCSHPRDFGPSELYTASFS